MTARLTLVLVACAALGASSSSATAAQPGPPEPTVPLDVLLLDPPSEAAAKVINWVIASRDNGDRPFLVIDKVAAELFVFDSSGLSVMRAPVLIGIAKGDDSAPGVGDLKLSRIPVSQRTTPAGRFQARFGAAVGHEEVLWIDHATAVSLHPVITSNPRERRLARLQSATPSDNRVTFGCINVGPEIYSEFIEPLFREAGGVVYIIPEARPLNEVFAGLPPDDPGARPQFDEIFAEFAMDGPAAPTPPSGF